ncbi:hypothetical protein [Lunatimonas salinarum]|uniref:hypothetical protein n=1 Tax=Lunatimonas salinarum TaxID=1774590 RepID=UPI001ADF8825|nr:hypothetical protein [Lunatimonas salinarum]
MPIPAGLGALSSAVIGWQITRSGLEGLIPWKAPGGRLGRAAGTAIGDVFANYLNDPGGYDSEQFYQDFAVGFIGDLAGGGLGELTSKYGSKAVAKGLTKLPGFNAAQIRTSHIEFTSDPTEQIQQIINANEKL